MTRKALASAVAAIAALTTVPSLAAAAMPGENGPIAYFSSRDGNREIYFLHPDGTEVRKTAVAGDDYDAALSMDGLRVVFSSNHDGGGNGLDVWVMATNGTNPLNLTKSPGDDLANAFSPDGTRILFHSRRAGSKDLDLYDMKVDGTDVRHLTNAVGDEVYGQYSPDGSRIVYKSTQNGPQDIWVMNADGKNQAPLTNNADTDDFPEFSPDGTKIVWQSTGNIMVMNANGTDPHAVLDDSGVYMHPTWSPDGTKIAFASGKDDFVGDIYVMNADGSNVTRVTTTPSQELHPRWGNLNRPPTCTPLSDTVNGPQGKTIQLTCTDPDGQPLSYAITANPSHGTLSSLNPAAGTVVYTPTRGYAVPDAFAFSATDGAADAPAVTASLTVVDTNQAPVCTDVTAKTQAGKAVDVALACSDPEGDPLTITIAGQPKGGKLGAIAGAKVRYTPAQGTAGADAFTFVASDGLESSAAATASLTVDAVVVAAPGPRDATVEVNPKGGFWLAVWYTVPKSCGKTCSTRVDVRRRTGKRLFDHGLLAKLRGDGPVLGTTTKKVKAGQRVKIWIPLGTKALLKAKWSTAGAFRATDSRVRFIYRSTTGARLEGVRDGRVKVWTHRLQRGDFPGLEKILP